MFSCRILLMRSVFVDFWVSNAGGKVFDCLRPWLEFLDLVLSSFFSCLCDPYLMNMHLRSWLSPFGICSKIAHFLSELLNSLSIHFWISEKFLSLPMKFLSSLKASLRLLCI